MSVARVPKTKGLASHVQVALRIRPLSDREKKEGQTNIVRTADKVITVKGKQFGPFDELFGTSSTQIEVYDVLVKQHVEHVLKGYNCTFFAYGQTGTGKTYSMEGGADKAYSGDWKNDIHLGIIPRSVEQIFECLEKQGCEEFCIRVSYIELYNEELYDLLAPNVDDNTRIRLFEDPAKKGSVIISGAEEVPVRNRNEVFTLLQRGSERKQMAATLMNNRSSRSHCVFTVSVVVRETTREGEELVRQGKLNLVDLAGSESIGRSGAQGTRAKEAGNINQSLLTLGRCINALTTNAGHVPYRESKLTRLLQDSLGGSTITTIIATISPGSLNSEETLSTLDYASRAKNIKNHPEANEKLSRKALLKEYTGEIEKLKRDLRNAREKNGIFLSQESYEGMEEKIKEQAKEIEDLQDQMGLYLDKFHKFLENQMIMDEQYNALFERKNRLESKLGQRVGELEETKKSLAESEIRSEAFSSSLDEMHDVAMKLRAQAEEIQNVALEEQQDLKYLWEKLDNVVELTNQNIVVTESVHAQIVESTKIMEKESVKMNQEMSDNTRNVGEVIDHLSIGLQTEMAKWKLDRENTAIEMNRLIMKVNEIVKKMTNETTQEVNNYGEELKKEIATLRQLTSSSNDRMDNFISSSNGAMDRLTETVDEMRKEIVKEIEKEREHVNEESEDRKTREETSLELERQMLEKQEKLMMEMQKIFEAHKELVTLNHSENVNKIESDREKRMKYISSIEGEVKSGTEKCGEIIEGVKEEKKKYGEEMRENRESVSQSVTSSENSLSAFSTKCSSLMSTVVQDIDQSEKELTSVVEKSGESQLEVQNEMEKIRDECTQNMKENVEKELSLITSSSSLVSSFSSSITQLSQKHVEEDIQKIVATGRTPEKRAYSIRDEVEYVPKLKRLLKDKGVNREARQSLYRTRESMLVNTDVILSPGSVGQKLHKLDDIVEMDENKEYSNVSQSRGRVLRSSNSSM